MKKYLFIGLPILFLLIVGLSLWLYIKSTPQYSLYLAYNAVKTHDFSTFTKYVDVNTIVSNVIDKALAASEKEAQAKSQGNQFEQLGEAFAQTLITSMKPGLIQKAKQTVQKEVETGKFEKDYKPANLVGAFFAIKVKKDGKVADVTIPAFNSKSKPLIVKMRQENGYWQVFDMNLDTPNLNMTGSSNSQSSTTKHAKFGERIDIGSGWYLTVATPTAYTSYDSFSGPQDGNKFSAIDVTFENTSNQSDSFSTDNLKLKDADNHEYSASYTGEEPSLSSGNLEAHGKVDGYLTFEIPQKEQPATLIYSNSFNNFTVVIGK